MSYSRKPLPTFHARVMRAVCRAKLYRREDALCRQFGGTLDHHETAEALCELVCRWGYLEWFDMGDRDAPLFYRLTRRGKEWRRARAEGGAA